VVLGFTCSCAKANLLDSTVTVPLRPLADHRGQQLLFLPEKQLMYYLGIDVPGILLPDYVRRSKTNSELFCFLV